MISESTVQRVKDLSAVDVLKLSHESDGISATVAAEAVPQVFAW